MPQPLMRAREAAMILALALGGFAAAWAGESAGLSGKDGRTLYALGFELVSRGGSLKNLALSSAELNGVLLGMKDAALGAKPRVSLQDSAKEIFLFMARREATTVAPRRKADEAFIEKMARRPGAKILEEDGAKMVYIPIRGGSGHRARPGDQIVINYKTALSGGETVDEAFWKNASLTTPFDATITCWRRGIARMRPGEKAELVCPASLAYGDQGNNLVPGGAAVNFTVRLLRVIHPRLARQKPFKWTSGEIKKYQKLLKAYQKSNPDQASSQGQEKTKKQ